MYNLKQLSVIAAVGAILIAPITASANGLGENDSWQFRSANGLAAELLRVELIEKKKGGAFKSFGPGNTTVYNSTAIGNYNETNIGVGACNGPHACTVTADQSNDGSPTTAIGVGSNSTDNSANTTNNSDTTINF